VAESEKGRGGRLKNGRKREGKRKKAMEWQREGKRKKAVEWQKVRREEEEG
jgi:hypothetical protein